MRPVTFTRAPEQLRVEGSGVCVYHKSYRDRLPAMPDCTLIEYADLCATYQTRDQFSGAEIVVFVGANKLFTPSTRFHGVWERLQYGLPASVTCYAIDTAPYIGPIWRLWPHFSLARLPWDGYTYSYLLESHYNAHVAGVRGDNPMSLERIRANAAGRVAIDYRAYFAPPIVHIERLSASVHREYQALKTALFAAHDTIGPVIKGLAEFAAAHCRSRSIPQEHRLFAHPEAVHIVRTDLKVDDYLTDRLLGKVAEVNQVCEALQP